MKILRSPLPLPLLDEMGDPEGGDGVNDRGRGVGGDKGEPGDIEEADVVTGVTAGCVGVTWDEGGVGSEAMGTTLSPVLESESDPDVLPRMFLTTLGLAGGLIPCTSSSCLALFVSLVNDAPQSRQFKGLIPSSA